MLVLFWLSQTWPVTLSPDVSPDSKETELGSSDQEASPSAGKNTRIVLVPCRAWKCVPTAISGGVDISEVPGCHLLQQMSSQWGSQKLLQGLVSHELTAYLSVFNLILTQRIIPTLSKGCKPDKFESHNSLKLSFTNILDLRLNFVKCESFLESNSPVFLLCVRQTWMTQLILATSLWGVIFLSPERNLLLICMVLQFMWRNDFILFGTYL